jgi:hypothetical protein
VNHEVEIKPEHGGYRWYCSCGGRGASAMGTHKAAEREHFYHVRRHTSCK